MTFYGVRHKLSGELMPLMMRGRGYSHWNPSTGNKVYAVKDTPRLLTSKRQAQRVIEGWFYCRNARNDIDGDICIGAPDGRQMDDLEVVKISVRIEYDRNNFTKPKASN